MAQTLSTMRDFIVRLTRKLEFANLAPDMRAFNARFIRRLVAFHGLWKNPDVLTIFAV